MKQSRLKIIICVLCLCVFWMPASAAEDTDTVYQVSTIGALMRGVYDGAMTLRSLQRHGDVGLGTFAYLDGEMILLDGRFYQVRADGTVHEAAGYMTTPFACVTFFDPGTAVPIGMLTSVRALEMRLDELLGSRNIFYAIVIRANFAYVNARSVPAQEPPYPDLIQVVERQPTFEFNELQGTLVGFWCPEYIDGINVPGYHFHFIAEDRKFGGHLLECRIRQGHAWVDPTRNFSMVLPPTQAFDSADLTRQRENVMVRVER